MISFSVICVLEYSLGQQFLGSVVLCNHSLWTLLSLY